MPHKIGPKETCWWLVRHAPLKNVQGLYIFDDAPLADEVDAASLAAIKNLIPEEAVWLTSPIRRCEETARLLGVDAKPTPEMREQNFGEWSGRSYDEVWQETVHWPTWDTPALVVPVGGESFEAVVARVTTYMQEASAHFAGQHVAVMTHVGVVRAALSKAWGISLDEALALDVPYLSTHTVVIEKKQWTASSSAE